MNKVINDLSELEGQLDIETLYKAKPPFILPEDAKAPLGVLLYDRVNDKVKCHVCGRWMKIINSQHLSLHKMDQELYREKFGFTKHIALCNRSLSAMISDRAKRNRFGEENRSGSRLKTIQKKRGNVSLMMRKLKSKPEFQNSFATCDAQLASRLRIAWNIVKQKKPWRSYPTAKDIHPFDSSLVKTLIYRFGGWRKAIRNMGFRPNEQGRLKKYPEEFLIACLRNVSSQGNYLRFSRQFYDSKRNRNFASSDTIAKRFASWRRALAMAGIS